MDYKFALFNDNQDSGIEFYPQDRRRSYSCGSPLDAAILFDTVQQAVDEVQHAEPYCIYNQVCVVFITPDGLRHTITP